jgi:anti-sigma factor RsiW
MRQACRDVVELVTDYLEDALDPAARAAFVEHVAGCEDCEELLRQVRASIALLGSLGPDPVEPKTLAPLLRSFAA